MALVKRRGNPGKRDQEIVPGGFEGYFRVAKNMAWRFYRFAFEEGADREQAAALAAMEALAELGPDSTLGAVTSVVRYVLYRQAKSYGWQMVHFKKADGKESARWCKLNVHYVGVSEWSKRLTRHLE